MTDERTETARELEDARRELGRMRAERNESRAERDAIADLLDEAHRVEDSLRRRGDEAVAERDRARTNKRECIVRMAAEDRADRARLAMDAAITDRDDAIAERDAWAVTADTIANSVAHVWDALCDTLGHSGNVPADLAGWIRANAPYVAPTADWPAVPEPALTGRDLWDAFGGTPDSWACAGILAHRGYGFAAANLNANLNSLRTAKPEPDPLALPEGMEWRDSAVEGRDTPDAYVRNANYVVVGDVWYRDGWRAGIGGGCIGTFVTRDDAKAALAAELRWRA